MCCVNLLRGVSRTESAELNMADDVDECVSMHIDKWPGFAIGRSLLEENV